MTHPFLHPESDQSLDTRELLLRHLSTITGLEWEGPHHRRMLAAVDGFLRRAGGTSAGELLSCLEPGRPELDGLLDLVTVGETYFFRDQAQLELVGPTVRAALASPFRTDSRVRVWSAGCATGEEPYTLAMVLDEEGLLEMCEIVATDLNPAAIHHAEVATFGRWSLRHCSDSRRLSHFEETEGGVRPRRRIRDAVEFRAMGLLDGPPRPASFDLVVCRNVLMYLTPDARHRAIGSLHDGLRPGGCLVLGPSDPVPRADGLEQIRTAGGVAYRRRTPGHRNTPRTGRPEVAAEDAPSRASLRDETVRPRLGAPTSARRRSVSRRRRSIFDERASCLATIRELGSSGDLVAAGRALEAAVDEFPLDAELRIMGALLSLEEGQWSEAADWALAAIYLEPELAVGHLLLARVERLAGRQRSARRHYRNALEVLTRLPPEAPVELADDELAGSLARAVAELVVEKVD